MYTYEHVFDDVCLLLPMLKSRIITRLCIMYFANQYIQHGTL